MTAPSFWARSVTDAVVRRAQNDGDPNASTIWARSTTYAVVRRAQNEMAVAG